MPRARGTSKHGGTVNPAKLKSYVDSESMNPDVSSLVGMPPSPDDLDGVDDEEEEEPAEPVDPMARGNELIGSWKEQGEALKESAGEIVDGAYEVGGDLLLNPVPEEAVDEVHDEFDSMPEDIQICIAQHVAPLADDDLTALATALVDGHDGETENADVKLVAAYLKCAALYAKDEIDPDDFVMDEDEDEDGDGDGEGDGDDDGDKPPVADGQSASPVAAPTKPLA